jgi:hypothetical protein
MLLLALTMASLIEVARHQTKYTNLLLLALNIIGLVLSHYFSALLFLLFVACYLAPFIFKRDHSVLSGTLKTSVAIIIAFLLLTPWLIRAYKLIGYSLEPSIAIPATSDSLQAAMNYGQYLWKLAGPLRNQIFLLVGLFGIVPLWMDRRTRSLAIWSAAILVCALPVGIGLPNIRADHMVIILFFPLCLCAACLLAIIWQIMVSHVPANGAMKACATLVLSGVMLWGIIDSKTVLNPSTIFVSKADLSAIQWIQENIPSDARFLINSVHWQSNMYRGNDGGFWLLPLTGNFTLPPPVIIAWGDREKLKEINETAKQIASLSTCENTFWGIVKANEISYIYLREGSGSLQANNLIDCQGLERIYFVDGVSIFSVSSEFK